MPLSRPRRRLGVFGASLGVHAGLLFAAGQMFDTPPHEPAAPGEALGVAVVMMDADALGVASMSSPSAADATEPSDAASEPVAEPTASGGSASELPLVSAGPMADTLSGAGDSAEDTETAAGGETGPDPWAQAAMGSTAVSLLGAAQLRLQAAQCWTGSGPTAPITMRVVLNDLGHVLEPPAALQEEPSSPSDRALEAKARDAIERCAPYTTSADAGGRREVRVVFTTDSSTSFQ